MIIIIAHVVSIDRDEEKSSKTTFDMGRKTERKPIDPQSYEGNPFTRPLRPEQLN